MTFFLLSLFLSLQLATRLSKQFEKREQALARLRADAERAYIRISGTTSNLDRCCNIKSSQVSFDSRFNASVGLIHVYLIKTAGDSFLMGSVHYVMLSKSQRKPFWLANWLYPQSDWAGWQIHVNCDVLRWLGTVLGRTKCANFFVKTYCLWHKQLENEIILGGHRAPFFRKWVRTLLFSTF